MSEPTGPKARTSKPICSPTKRNNSTNIEEDIGGTPEHRNTAKKKKKINK